MRNGKHLGELEARRRRRSQVLLALLAVVAVAIGGGYVLYERPWKDDRRHGDLIVQPEPPAVSFAPALGPASDSAPAPSPSALSAALAPALRNPSLGLFSGSITDGPTGKVLWSAAPERPMLPASVTKILTAAAALTALPADHRVTTKVVQGGPGEIVLVGGGDATLTAQPPGVNGSFPGAARIDDLVQQLRKAGTPVTSILIDTSLYSGPAMARGWLPEDVAAGFITPVEALMLDAGRIRPHQDVSPRSHTPALDAGRALAAGLGVNPAAVRPGRAAPDAVQLAAVQSAPLRVRLGQMMDHSDNILAETIGREIAQVSSNEMSFAGAFSAIKGVLAQAGFDMAGVMLADTSGMSLDNRIPARLLDRVMAVSAGPNNAKLRPMLDFLPVAGATGTLAERYGGPHRAGAGWVRAKTGTLTQASALTGYVLDDSGRVLTFSLMTNDRPPEAARAALDAIAVTLRGCGCL